MECLLQYWDELDDLYWSIAALREQVRRAAVFALFVATAAGIAMLSVVAANQQPDLSLLVATLLGFSLLIRPRSASRGPAAG